MTRIQSIVKNKKGSLFLMNHDDFRFNSPDYTVISEVIRKESVISTFNNRHCQKVTCINGNIFEVFSDYSARKFNVVTK